MSGKTRTFLLPARPANKATEAGALLDGRCRIVRKQPGWVAIGCGLGAGALAVTALVTYLLNNSGAQESRSTTAISLSPFGLGVKF